MMKKPRNHGPARKPLTRAQREVMEIIWDLNEATVMDVANRLSEAKPVARNTVKTLMERMEANGWLTHRTEGRSFVYSPLVPREESLGQRLVDIIEKTCGGNPEKLMMALIEYRGLSADETDRIQQMLNEAKDKAR